MNAKERKAHNRFEQKEWKKKFSEWLLNKDCHFILDEALISYSQVKIPRIESGKKNYYYFDIIFSDSTKAKSTNFQSVSLSELLNAINVGVSYHKFVHITKIHGDYVIESYTYEEMIPFLSISPFVFKFLFNKRPDRKKTTHIDRNLLLYTSFPTPAIDLTASRLVKLINMFGDFKTNKKE